MSNEYKIALIAKAITKLYLVIDDMRSGLEPLPEKQHIAVSHNLAAARELIREINGVVVKLKKKDADL